MKKNPLNLLKMHVLSEAKTIKFLILILLCQFLSSCNKYDDLEVLVKEDQISLTEPQLDIALGGSEPIDGILKIKYGDKLLHEEDISSHLDEEFSTRNLNLQEIDHSVIFEALRDQKPLFLNLVFINEKERLKVEDSIEVTIKAPPVSQVLAVDGAIDSPEPLSKEEINNFLSKERSNIIQRPGAPENLNYLDLSKDFSVEITVDTVYYRTIIGKYPIPSSWSRLEPLENVIQAYIQDGIDNIKSDSVRRLPNGKHVVQEIITTDYSGDVGVYLVNFTEDEDYFVQQIGLFRTDRSKPTFSQYNPVHPTNFHRNPNTEGNVWLDTRSFYGHSPFTIPFVGMAVGDISEIYVNNIKVNFTVGERIFFKRRIHLDNGYNQIPVKIVDTHGNTNETFLTVTTERIIQED